ncbi:MAG: class I SAM-dependent methyltransferase [Anaerolineae bacterium]|jgi:23S rRNA (cytosine1962-C5)-methyltransferase|nr:class I SAM-dependent methyltransferase [Anaerolineae bacterium]
MNPDLTLLTSPDWGEYELLDSGDGLKLERYGSYILIRPEAEAVWSPNSPIKDWYQRAHAEFITTQEKNGGHWKRLKSLPENWNIHYKALTFSMECKGSRHVGLFPEQAEYWDWIVDQVQTAGNTPKVLNLFGYTGAATLAAASAGAAVTHIDASKRSVTWARQNAALSGLQDAPIRWIVDDALKFVQREKRRESYYEGIILDPPKFGRGPKGEVWEFYKLLSQLLHACADILSPHAKFLALTAYSVKASPISLRQAVAELMPPGGTVEAGEIALQEVNAGRLLSTAIFARWSR